MGLDGQTPRSSAKEAMAPPSRVIKRNCGASTPRLSLIEWSYSMVSSYLPHLEVAMSTQAARTRMVFEENSGLDVAAPIDRIEDIIALASKNTEAVLRSSSLRTVRFTRSSKATIIEADVEQVGAVG